MYLITFFSELFVLVRISPYQVLHQTVCATRCKTVFFLSFCPRLGFVCALVWEFSSRKLLSKVGPPPSYSCFSFLDPSSSPLLASAALRPPPLYQHHQHWHGLWRKNRAQLPVVCIVCLIHSISPRLFLHSRWGEMGQFSLNAPNFHLALIRGSKCFCMHYFSTDILHHPLLSLFI